MGCTTLILGGARSGKSRRALTLAANHASRTIIATAEPGDAEMSARIAAHRAERDSTWRTIEEPLDIARALNTIPPSALSNGAPESIVVVDCLTLWVSNLMHAGRDVEEATRKLIGALRSCRVDAILISNEVGLGLVPETPLGREFRDCQGRLNQRVAEAADVVEFVAAGLPLRLKP